MRWIVWLMLAGSAVGAFAQTSASFTLEKYTFNNGGNPALREQGPGLHLPRPGDLLLMNASPPRPCGRPIRPDLPRRMP
jgi:hypothetical protein